MFQSLGKLVPKKKDRIASGRNELKEALGEASPEMIEAFRAMTPEQKARGRLVGVNIASMSSAFPDGRGRL
jgi:hypothetical protein